MKARILLALMFCFLLTFLVACSGSGSASSPPPDGQNECPPGCHCSQNGTDVFVDCPDLAP